MKEFPDGCAGTLAVVAVVILLHLSINKLIGYL